MTDAPDPARQRLVAFSRNVLYDFEMVEVLSKRMTDITTRQVNSRWDKRVGTTEADLRPPQFVTNAFIESLTIHARALVEFLFLGGSAVVAADYFEGAAEPWKRVRGKFPDVLRSENLRERVGSEIAHLGEVRADFIEGGPGWNHFAIYTALSEVMQRFAGAVPDDRVVGDFRSRVRAAATPVERRQMRMDIDAVALAPLAFPVATQSLPPG